METQDNLSSSNDAMAVVTVEPAPAVVAMTMDEGTGVVTDHDTTCGQSAASNVNASSTPPKKGAAERELRQPFPVKVYEMLENAEKKRFSHIVSWNETGTGFMVHDKDHFTKEIVPHYFNLTKYKSFQRQVSSLVHCMNLPMNLPPSMKIPHADKINLWKSFLLYALIL